MTKVSYTRILKLLSLAVLIFGLTVFSSVSSDSGVATGKDRKDAAGQVNWLTYDVGLKMAQEDNKHVFNYFTAPWCGYCRKMEREVFTDPRVIEMLNNDFIAVRIDGESRNELDIDGYRITERNLAITEFGVRGYPTFWFLKPDGTKLGNFTGYRPTDFVLEALTFVRDYKYDSTRTDDEEAQP